MEQKFCPGCEEPVIDKLPGCPLQCGTEQCLPFKEKQKYDYTKMPIIWVMGGPGSGKMTQCMNIVKMYGLVYISVGQMLRDEMARGSIRSRCFNSVMGRGELAPNDLVIALLKEAIERNAAMDVRGFVIKGFPRQKRQGLEFERNIGHASAIIYLEASVDTLFRRLQARAPAPNRIDEKPCTLRLRMETFMNHNPDIFELYKYRLVKINAEKAPDQVFQEISAVLNKIVTREKSTAAAVTK